MLSSHILWFAGFATALVSEGHGRNLQTELLGLPSPWTHDIYSARFATDDGDMNSEGEAHGHIKPPGGSTLASVKVSKNEQEEIAVFVTKNGERSGLEHAFIVIHGKLRDGGHYWTTMNDAIKEAKAKNYRGITRKSIVIAPQFFSTVYNSGQYTGHQLAWGDLNAWQAGAIATHPLGTEFSSIDVIDGLLGELANREKYPNMKNVTIVGHGGGGQLVQRYAAVGKDAESHMHVRYIHSDPSSCLYFTKDRPILEDVGGPSKTPCLYYNTWRYGFDHFPGTLDGHKSPKEYFRQYITRDAVSLVGYQDVKNSGDSSCMAEAQGGSKRRDRNLVWYRYIHTLARTSENLEGFPGRFDSIPDWSFISNHTVNLRLSVAENATHDVAEVLQSESGLSALFSDGDIDVGWRPGAAT